MKTGQHQPGAARPAENENGLPGKPDHQSLEALITLRPAAGGQGVWLRARFQRTIWDSNGDSRTKQVSEPEVYRDFSRGWGLRTCLRSAARRRYGVETIS